MVIDQKIIIRRIIKSASRKHTLYKRGGHSREDPTSDGAAEKVRAIRWRQTIKYEKT